MYWLRPGILAGLLLAAPGQAADSSQGRPEPVRLYSGVIIEGGVESPGAEPTIHPFVVDVPPRHRAVLYFEQDAADVSIVARGPGLEAPWLVDAPLDFDGLEVFLLPPAVRGPVEIDVVVKAPGGPGADPEARRARPSRWSARVEFVAVATQNRVELEALGLLTAAGRAWADGTGEGRRRARDLYRRASDHPGLAPAKRRRLRTQARYAAAVLHRLLGEHADAERLAREARLDFEALGDGARLADVDNEIGLVASAAGRLADAREAFERAAAQVEAIADPFRRATVSGNLCLLHLMANELDAGVDCYRTALVAVRRIDDLENESVYLLNTAQAERIRGDLDAARTHYLTALEIQRRQGFSKLVAKTLNNVAGLHLTLGDFDDALNAYREAATIFEGLGDARWHGRSLHNLGAAHYRLGDFAGARLHVKNALAIHRQTGHRIGITSALKIQGHVLDAAGDLAGARLAYLEARELDRHAEDDLRGATSSAFLARLDLKERLASSAAPRLEAALGIVRDAGRESLSAILLADLGRAYSQLDRRADADRALREAFTIFVRLGDGAGRGRVLLLQADHASPTFSSPEAARRALPLLEGAVAAFDGVTLSLPGSDQRAFFAGSKRTARERYVEALLVLGRAEDALEASEATHAWALRTALGPATAGDDAAGATVAEMRELLGPAGDTAWLHTLTGERGSHLFLLTGEGLEVFPLPAVGDLERSVHSARNRLLRGVDPGLETLSRSLLGDAWDRLDRPPIQRLVLTLDGPLHALPFAALPRPDGGGTLLERFEIVRLPSAGVLGLERRRRAARSRPSGFAAVLADPVFSARDLRLPVDLDDHGAGAVKTDAVRPRLRSSAREARAVLRAARGAVTRVATGFEADRDWLLDPRLADFRILHFATHARIDPTFAARSGLELSAFDSAGQPRDGFVAAPEIRRLKLSADLVVLSACATALGPRLRGEGFRGLVQAFFEAGAGRVIASLWPVSDRATADLMESFYQHVGAGSSFATALRQAQLELAGRPDAEPSASWAGFVLIGDWRDSTNG